MQRNSMAPERLKTKIQSPGKAHSCKHTAKHSNVAARSHHTARQSAGSKKEIQPINRVTWRRHNATAKTKITQGLGKMQPSQKRHPHDNTAARACNNTPARRATAQPCSISCGKGDKHEVCQRATSVQAATVQSSNVKLQHRINKHTAMQPLAIMPCRHTLPPHPLPLLAPSFIRQHL